jgi:hypothetical protein
VFFLVNKIMNLRVFVLRAKYLTNGYVIIRFRELHGDVLSNGKRRVCAKGCILF